MTNLVLTGAFLTNRYGVRIHEAKNLKAGQSVFEIIGSIYFHFHEIEKIPDSAEINRIFLSTYDYGALLNELTEPNP